jgi:hypothetical protein
MRANRDSGEPETDLDWTHGVSLSRASIWLDSSAEQEMSTLDAGTAGTALFTRG